MTPGFGSTYGHNENCEMIMKRDVRITPDSTFAVENSYDKLSFHVGQESPFTAFEANKVPTSLKYGEKITWRSDGSVSYAGWKLCFEDQPVSDSRLFDFTGDCDQVGDCVSTVNFGNLHYGNRDKCEVTLKQDVRITPDSSFEVELDGNGHVYDKLTLDGRQVAKVEDIPKSLSAGESFTWTSDSKC
eukprot:UN00643